MDRRINPHLITIIAVLVLAILSIGSASKPKQPGAAALAAPQRQADMYYKNFGFFGQSVIFPVKDFVTLGNVFTESTFKVEKGTIEGDIFTIQALYKKAAELGADAIINVIVDKRTDWVSERITVKDSTRLTIVKQETWYGSALAIKYTEALNEPNVVLNKPVYFNYGSGATVSE